MMEGKEEAGQDGLNAWFESFVDVVDVGNAKEWDALATSLDQEKEGGYLDKNVEWEDDQYTPLHYAAQKGDLDIVEELIEKHGVPVDIKTGTYLRTPLQLAALEGNLKMVTYLVDKGAKWNAIDSAKSNAPHYAASEIQEDANTEMVKFLMRKGADYQALANDKSSL
jgi:ankyrin repeat protein